MLVQWLCSFYSDSHWLSDRLNWSEVALMAVQFCSHLIMARVLKKVEERGQKDKFEVFFYI